MKSITSIVSALVLVLTVGGITLKLMIPLQYKEAPLRPSALNHLANLQRLTSLSPVEAAQAYKYFQTDYENGLPPRIQITETDLGTDQIRVEFYDPRAEDDSIWQTRHRIYLFRDAEGRWIPDQHEWSHKGRGRFGWTTQPTI